VIYSLRVTNTGNCADTFDLALSGNQWTTDAPVTVGPLASGVGADVPVTVTVPLDAACGDGDAVTVGLTSQGDGTSTASSLLRLCLGRPWGGGDLQLAGDQHRQLR